MTNSTDPSLHRERERRLLEHVERLLSDDRLRVDTLDGRRPVVALRRDVRKEDGAVDLKRLMSDLGVFDRPLEAQMPVGRQLNVTLSRSYFLFFSKTIGRLKVLCLPPWRALLEGKAPAPLSRADLERALAGQVDEGQSVPSTLVVLSTSGFSTEAHELAQRRQNRTLILVEPNAAGGWTVSGPPEMQALVDLFDPELDADKRQRVREAIQTRRADLLGGGLSADRLAAATALPLQLVEDELKSYAKEEAGLVARRLEGNVVLFREGTVPLSSGGSQMPFLQRVKALLGGKGDNEKKIGLLSERRAALSLQRDRAYEDMGLLEQKETEMRQQFKEATSSITRKRITSHLVQLRKDLERRHQLLGVLNQQINVISTHLHNLELVQQGQSAQLPDSEELANDAAAAEEVLAELQANAEMASSIAATGPSGLSEEEQALYEELEREAAGEAAAKAQAPQSAQAPAQPATTRVAAPREAARPEPPPLPTPPERHRGEAEPG